MERSINTKRVRNHTLGIDGLVESQSVDGQTVVLVEDLLSMMKVGEVCKCFTLLGTSLKEKFLTKLIGRDEVLIWLDPDEPGQRAARKIAKQLRGLVKTRIIHSDVDPKYLSVDKVKELLGC